MNRAILLLIALLPLVNCSRFPAKTPQSTPEDTVQWLNPAHFYTRSDYSEFRTYENGLVYDPATMAKLRYIVDSLNLKFRLCDLKPQYRAHAQARGHYVRLTKKLGAAEADLKKGISFENFLRKYPEAEVKRDLVVLKTFTKDEEGEFLSCRVPAISSQFGQPVTGKPERRTQPWQGRWLHKRYDKKTYGENELEGLFFATEFQSRPLPEAYARLVGYSDCLIDTTALLFLEDATREVGLVDRSQHPAGERFLRMATDFPGQPRFPKFPDDYENEAVMTAYQRAYDRAQEQFYRWDSLRLDYLDRELSKTAAFGTALREALDEALRTGGSSDALEFYVARYLSKSQALLLKRKRRVVGYCSQDDSPRLHALNIAALSAQTLNWEIFLRSHLNIMNDYFERQSDGSYAWGKRQTYIRELEELGINVTDLLLGITLRVENAGENHYYGDISRVGRALSESRNPDQVERQMLALIGDDQLDDFNRMLTCYLFLHYNRHLADAERKAANQDKIKAAIGAMPGYLAQQVLTEDK
jgi:hypothetical protein